MYHELNWDIFGVLMVGLMVGLIVLTLLTLLTCFTPDNNVRPYIGGHTDQDTTTNNDSDNIHP